MVTFAEARMHSFSNMEKQKKIQRAKANWLLPFFLFFLSMWQGSLLAQEIVYTDSIHPVFSPFSKVGIASLNSCDTSFVASTSAIFKAYDITNLQNGISYGYGEWFDQDEAFYRVEVPSGAFQIGSTLTTDKKIRGVTCDENDFLYAAGEGITRQSVEWPDYQETFLGYLPSNMQCQGDMTYRQGKFYLHSINNQLVEVNMKDPSKSKVVMDFPSGILPIDALTTVQVSCDSSTTYAIGRTPDNSKIYEINFNDWTLTEICDLPISITGAGTQTECMLPPCNVFLDLDNDNSSFAFRGDFCADSFCIPPVMVADTDVVIVSAFNMIESVTLELQDILDAGQEYLMAVMGSNINVIGNNTALLVLENNGNATIADFENAIKTVQYQNDATTVTFGVRKVLATAYAGGEPSLVSTAELPISNEQMKTVGTVMDPACHSFSNGNISVSTEGGAAPYSYQWEIPQQGDFIENLSAGIYPFIVSDSLGCTKPDTVFLGDPDTLIADISYTGQAAICDNSGQLEGIGIGGSGALSYQWSNGVVGNMNSDVGYGSYTLTAQDTNGCTATASYQIPQGDTALVIEEGTVCEGNSISWNGTLYSSDTLACEVFTLPNGCDSTVCLSLTVNPVPVVSIIADGNFCETEEVVLSTGSYPTYQWSTNEVSPSISISDAGNYSVTVTNANGCTSTAFISLTLPLVSDVSHQNPSCHGEDGRLVFENTNGGTPPFQYSVDGGIQFSDNNQFDGLLAGDYLTIVEDAEGCQVEILVMLLPPTPIILDTGDDIEIGLGESITLNASTNLTNPAVSWHPPDYLDCPDCLETTAMPLATIQYEIEVMDSNGCTARDVIQIVVNDRSSIYTPNVFSPNGDGINDFFIIHSDASITTILSLQVFDRWGGMVFSGNNLKPNETEGGWDGMAKGEPAQSGVYVYVAEIQKADGSVELVSGEVVLVW